MGPEQAARNKLATDAPSTLILSEFRPRKPAPRPLRMQLTASAWATARRRRDPPQVLRASLVEQVAISAVVVAQKRRRTGDRPQAARRPRANEGPAGTQRRANPRGSGWVLRRCRRSV